MANLEPIMDTSDQIYLTDGGLETTLIFHHGIELPYFAAFDLLKTTQGRFTLRQYYETYAAMAVNSKTGFILESATWRANKDWAEKLGYNKEQLASANLQAIDVLHEIKNEFSIPGSPFMISGCIGPRGDGYLALDCMTAVQAANYHQAQVETFATAKIDMITAMTMTYPEEAIGIVRAAQSFDLPVVISFTTETDGRLPNGMSLQAAIEMVDLETSSGPAYYMINCAHPDHFRQALKENAAWVNRIKGIRANASRMSHAELDAAEELDDGNPVELGKQYQELREVFPQFSVLGGCCGTDHNHISQICHHCTH